MQFNNGVTLGRSGLKVSPFCLGVTPWGPLRSGALSGEYSRHNMSAESKGRKTSIARNMTEHAYSVIDTQSWVRSRPGVSAPIIGARTLEQLKDNLAALELTLEPADIAELTAISQPTLGFPIDFLKNTTMQSYSGLTVNGKQFGTSPL